MATIVSGWFETQAHADEAVAALHAAGFGHDEVDSFYLGPPGQHGDLPLSDLSDHQHSEGTKETGKGAAKGAVVGGVLGAAAGAAAAAVTAPLGPAAVVAGAGVGAYVGSLAGGASASRDSQLEQASREEPIDRPAGAMVSVYTDRVGEAQAIDTLRASGATGIERADGQWIDGHWADFDPHMPPRLIHDQTMPRRDEGTGGAH